MPLTVSRRKDTGTLWITGTVRPSGAKVGRRIRQRAGSDSRELAEEEARTVEAQILRDFHLGERPSTYSFSEAVTSYLKHQERSKGTSYEALRLLDHWRAAPLGSITQAAVDAARPKILTPGASDSTWRKTVSILSAIMTHAARRKWCEAPDFDLPPESKGRTRFLLPAEYERLHDAAAPHLKPLLTYLICTGSRLGEALSLDWSQVDLTGRRVNVWADQTKGDARRVVDLTPASVRALAGLLHREGRVFLTHHGEPYRDAGEGYGGHVKSAWRTACRKAGLEGFTPHHLRHSFASWYWALHRDLIALQHAGGWSDIKLVTRYAHLMPVGQETAIRRVWGIEKAAARVA
jgi:integrase